MRSGREFRVSFARVEKEGGCVGGSVDRFQNVNLGSEGRMRYFTRDRFYCNELAKVAELNECSHL